MVASGCSKKDGNSVASPTASVTVQTSPGASATPSGTNTGGTVTATPKATGGVAETTSTITREQVEKIPMTSTYDDLVKETGSKGKLVKEENGKQSYEFAISNQPGYYALFVYFPDGKISEKNVYMR